MDVDMVEESGQKYNHLDHFRFRPEISLLVPNNLRFDFYFLDTSTTGKSAEYETEESCSKTVVMPQEPVQLEEENSVVILDSGESRKI